MPKLNPTFIGWTTFLGSNANHHLDNRYLHLPASFSSQQADIAGAVGLNANNITFNL
jgi:hypothetical protein